MENRKIRIDRTAALIRNHAERRAGNYIALKLPRKKTTKKEKERKRNTKKEKYKEIYANFRGSEGGNRKIRIDRTAALILNHAERWRAPKPS